MMRSELLLAARLELHELIKRTHRFDTIQLPFLDVAIAATDIGIVIGWGLTLVGYWLVASLRRERRTLRSFVYPSKTYILKDPDWEVRVIKAGWVKQESTYAYRSIVSHWVFGTISRSSITYFTLMLFLAPPALLTINGWTTISDLFQLGWASLSADSILTNDSFVRWHILLEFSAIFAVWVFWLKAFWHEFMAITTMRSWGDQVAKWRKEKESLKQIEAI